MPEQITPARIQDNPDARTSGARREDSGDDDWADLNKRINDLANRFPAQVADKKTLLDELHYGDSPFILIYAHFDGERLYLPGVDGDTLSVDEIATIHRANDPTVRERVIVLVACSTAAVRQSESLVQTMLRLGIARSVFATDRPYNAREIPALMERLRAKPLREAGGQLHQHVELERPQVFPNGFQKTFKESEVFSGE